MAKLFWIGPDFRGSSGTIPLPEGWPAEAHEDADSERVDAKLAFRLGEEGEGPPVYSLEEPEVKPAPKTEDPDPPVVDADPEPESIPERKGRKGA